MFHTKNIVFPDVFLDVDVEKPDEKSIMTYVAQFLKAYPAGDSKVGAKISFVLTCFDFCLEEFYCVILYFSISLLSFPEMLM